MVRTGIIALLLVTMARASSVPSSDDSTGAEPLVAAAVASMLSHYHYEQMPLDDRVSERWLDAYVDMLDPSRMVFLQSDVQEFQQWRTTLDDDARRFRPELEAANAIYGRYRDRYHERAAHVDTLLSGELDC
jgi:carboxyl-terminal processing protease